MAQKITFNSTPKNGDTIKFTRNGVVYTFTYVIPSNYSFNNYKIDIMNGNYAQSSRAFILIPAYCDFLKVEKEGVYDAVTGGTGSILIDSNDGSILSNFESSSDFATVESNSVLSSITDSNPLQSVVNKVSEIMPASTKSKNTKYWILGLLVVLVGGYFVMKSKKK